jgi:hypothetical protein
VLTPSNGVVTLGADVTVNAAGSGYTIAASAAGLTGATSAAFDVAAHGPAFGTAFRVQPGNAIVGEPIAPAVEVAIVDQYGNTVTTGVDATGTVTLAASGNPAARLFGTVSGAAAAGVATFADVRVADVNTSYALGASSTVAAGSSTSATFDVTAGETLLATVNFPVNDMIITGSTLVFADSLGLATMPATGGAITRIASDTMGANGIATDGATVFWASWNGSSITINRVAITGGAVDTIVTGLAFGTPPLKLDGTYVYYAAAGQVRRLLKTATSYAVDELYDTFPSNTPSGGGGLGALEIEAGGTDLIYSAGSEIRRAPAAGGGAVTVVALENPGSAITQSGANLYYTTAVSCCDFEVRTVAATGGTPTAVAGVPAGGRITTDGTNLYMTSGFGLIRVPIAGGTYLTLDSFGAARIAIDGTHVYWLRDLADRTEVYRAAR